MNSDQSIMQPELAEFYTAHNAWLFAWLRRKLGCAYDAADLTQDTFLNVLLKNDFGNIREPRAYLTTTATRLMIDAARRRRLEQAYLEALALGCADLSDFSPEQYRQAFDTLHAIAAMLEGLPENVCRAFLMSRLEERSHAEIAEHLGVSVSMVGQYLARALVHCYRVVEDGGEYRHGIALR